ncbi:MAG: pilin [Arenimonas sp.]
MKQFVITFAAVLFAVAIALFGYDYFIVKPRAALQAQAVQVDLNNAQRQAQNIAHDLDAAVTQTISNANDTMNAQTGEMQQRALIADAIARGSMFKTALAEYFMTNGQWPKSHQQSGMAKPESYAGGAVSSISVGEKGIVIIALNEKVEAGAKIKLTPEANEQSYMINWHCSSEGSEKLMHNLPACGK